MALSYKAKAAHLEGVVRSISKELYGKGPKDIWCTRRGNVFLVRCKGVLSPVEIGLVSQGPEGVLTLERVRRELFEKERELIKRLFEGPDNKVEAVLQDLRHDKDERLLVVVTEG